MAKLMPGSNRCQIILQAYVNNSKEPDTSQKLGSRNFRRIVDSVLSKAKSAISLLLSLPGQ